MVQTHPWRATLAAVAVLAALTGGTVVAHGDDEPGPAAARSARHLDMDPYATTPCPDRITRDDIVGTLPDLDGAVSMRLCFDDTEALEHSRHPPAESELAAREAAAPPTEALVTNLDVVRAELGMSAPYNPGRCATIYYVSLTGGVVVTYADGRQVVVDTNWCNGLRLADGQRRIPAGDLHDQFFNALAHQRATYDYGREVDAALDCNAMAEAPVVPRHEEIVAAASCSRYVEATGRRTTTPLDETALARLRTAWAEARPHERWPLSREDECTEQDDEVPDIVVRTTHGDAVHLGGTDCGWIYLRGWQPGHGWEVPVAFEDVAG